MEIIPLVLDEKVVKLLSDDFLSDLARCSTSAVKLSVKEYLSNAKADKATADRIRKAYLPVFDAEDFLKDEKLIAVIKQVELLDFSDINPQTPSSTLDSYEECLEAVLHDPRSAAYIQPIRAAAINSRGVGRYSGAEP